jgi:hypothetical protein
MAATARVYLALLAGDHAAAASAARDALARAPDDRPLLWALAESLRREGSRASLDEAFARFRVLAPIASRARDLWWWRGQLGQLEALSSSESARGSSRADIVARVNQLSALDQVLGGEALRRRFESLRVRAAEPRPGEPTEQAP